MEEKKLNIINGITNGFHDKVASINEEFVDGNNDEVLKIIEDLKKDLNHLRTNIKTNGI